MDDSIFQPYLESICDYYSQWWSQSVLTDTERQQTEPFNFDLYVREVKRQSEEKTKVEDLPPLPLVEALDQHVTRKRRVLLVGRPGAGKTKALFRYLLELAKQALDNPLAKIPVLVRLKDYQISSGSQYSGIIHLIRKELLSLKLEEIERYLFLEQKFLLLIDGLNESTSLELRKDLQQFLDSCRKRQVPIVFTTRLLGYRHLEIETQLEIQPISPEERQRFLKERVSPTKRQQLQRWLDRARQSEYTPFVMWMLAEVAEQINSSSQLDNFSLGEAFREFVRLYQDKLYEEGRICDEDCETWSSKLKHLASAMLLDEKSENFIIFRRRAIDILGSEALLNDLIRHHLLVERRGDGKIEFCHQLLQEYYAAEWLLLQLPNLSDEQLKYYFLNYLKWTEAICLVLGLIDEDDFIGRGREQAIRVVKLALGIDLPPVVDLMLGARLAGEVKQDFQEQAVKFIFDQAEAREISQLSKTILLNETRSKFSVSYLSQTLRDKNYFVRIYSAYGLGTIGSEDAIESLIQALDEEENISKAAATGLGMTNSDTVVPYLKKALISSNIYVSQNAASALGRISSQAAVTVLIQSLMHEDEVVRLNGASALGELSVGSDTSERVISCLETILFNDESPLVRRSALLSIKKLVGGNKAALSLKEALKDEDSIVRGEAVHALGEIGFVLETSLLIKLANDADPSVRGNAVFSLGKIEDKTVIPVLINALSDSHPVVCEKAAFALGEIRAQEAIPFLAGTIKSDNPSLRRSAVNALSNINTEMALLHLQDLIDDEDPLVRWKAIEVLEEPKTQLFASDIKYVLTHHSDKIVRVRAVSMLSNNFEEEALLTLASVLNDEDSIVRSSAAKALGKIDSDAARKILLEAFNNALSSNDLGYFMSIISALENIGTGSLIAEFQKVYWLSEAKIRFYMEQQLRRVIDTIQNRCGFYNYEIAQSSPPPAVNQDSGDGNQGQTINNTFNIEAINAIKSNLNLGGTVQGNQISNQGLLSNFAHSTVDRPNSLIQTKDVLEIIFNTGRSLERSSREVRNLPEESLREFFIPSINAKYPDSATPETRNKNGKTDILVRIAGKNLLIAECKFWGGEKKLKETLDQLLRYTTIRDTQLAILIFSRNQGFTDVKQKIPQAMKQHPSSGKEVKIDLEKAWYEYVIFHPDDQSCELTLTILAFHIPP